MWPALFSVQIDPAVSLTAAFTVAGILIATATPKLRALPYFEEIVVEYRILPEGLSRLLARGLPWIELVLAVALLSTVTRSLAAGAVALLVTAFALAIGINLLRGRSRIDCGCGVTEGTSVLIWPMLGRNVFLLILLAVAACDSSGRSLVLADALCVVVGGGALIGLYMTADYLLANIPRLNEHRS